MISLAAKELKLTDCAGDELYINPETNFITFEADSQHLQIVVEADKADVQAIITFLQSWLNSR